LAAIDLSTFGLAVAGPLSGGLCAYLGARAAARAQARAAEVKAESDFQLQAERLKHEAAIADLAERQAKLAELYVFLTEVNSQCSQTQAQLDHQMGRKPEEHEARWTALLVRLYQARATAAIYFPDLSTGL
jgi:hypothetical protein